MNKNNLLGDLHSPGFLGNRPIIGLMMFVFGSLIFVILAYNLVMQGPLIQWDIPIAESFHTLAINSSPLVINIMIAGFYLGKQGIIVIGALLGVYFLYKRFWRELLMVVAGFGLSGLIFITLSHIFKRPRPFLLFDKPIWPGSPNIPGFPSGHTISVVVCFGFLAYLLVPKIKSYLGKALVITITLVIMLFIGFSRLYVGDHYLTDIIAGYAVGIAWSGLAYTYIEWFFQRYYLRKQKKRLNYEKTKKSFE